MKSLKKLRSIIMMFAIVFLTAMMIPAKTAQAGGRGINVHIEYCDMDKSHWMMHDQFDPLDSLLEMFYINNTLYSTMNPEPYICGPMYDSYWVYPINYLEIRQFKTGDLLSFSIPMPEGYELSNKAPECTYSYWESPETGIGVWNINKSLVELKLSESMAEALNNGDVCVVKIKAYIWRSDVKHVIEKEHQDLRVNWTGSKYLKYKDLKKKKRTIKLKIYNAKTKVEYSVSSKYKKYVSVSKSGVITFKKGTPKGKYKVKVFAPSDKIYKSVELSLEFIVK